MKIDISKAKMSMKAYILKAKWIQALIPLVVLTLYFITFSWFLSWLLPEDAVNVNAVFAKRMWKYSLILAAGLYLIFFVLFKIKKGNKLTFENSIEKFYAGDSILILLPLTPIVQYIINNQDILSPLGSLYVLAVFMIFAVLFIIVIPTLLGVVGSTKTLIILGLAFTFIITNMASLSAQFHWFEQGSLKIQLALFSAIFFVSWILYNLNGRKILYIVIAICFLTNSAIQLASGDGAKSMVNSTDNRTESALNSSNNNTKSWLSSTGNKLVELVGSKKPLSTPNIYLLIYDSYVINETMLAYGIDNSAQEKYLKNLGFKLYPHTYSVGSNSISTMSRTLNASTEFYGIARRGTSGDGITQNLLKAYGYETYGVFPNDYYYQGIGSSYDFSFSKASIFLPKLFLNAIFMGEFRFDVGFDSLTYKKYIEYKSSILESVPNKPRFVYMHTYYPGHSQNSGACLPNETELFRERLVKANDEMKQDIETISRIDPGALIIVAGDHGPDLTKNCYLTGGDYDISEISRLDIQDRFGTFLAIKWPDDNISKYDDITVLQDLFPATFAYLFQDDKLLEAKVASTTLDGGAISGASVTNGIIHGGINDGEPLFMDQR